MDLRFTPEEEGFRKGPGLPGRPAGAASSPRSGGGAARATSTRVFDERLAWEQRLGADGWTCVGLADGARRPGPAAAQQVIWYEEYARAGGPGPARPHRRGPDRADHHRLRHAEQQERFLPASGRHRAVVPGLLRARTPAPTSPTSRPRAELDGDEWVINGQKVWTSLAHWSDWCFVLARTDRDAPQAQGHLVPARSAWTRRASRSARSSRSPAPSEFNEVFFDGARTPADLVVGGVEQRLEGRHGHARLRAGRVDARPAARLRARVRASCSRLAAAHRPDQRPGVPPAAGRRWHRPRDHALEQPAHAHRRPTGPSCPAPAYISKLYWARLHRDLGELRRPRTPLASTDRARSADAAAATSSPRRSACSSSPGPTPSTAAPTRSSATSSASGPSACRPSRQVSPADRQSAPAPPYVAGHGLLAGKRCVVTAAAGTGIGFAAARRCVEEGARCSSATSTSAASARPPTTGRRSGAPPWRQRSATSPTRTTCRRLVDAAVAELGGIDVWSTTPASAARPTSST